MGYLPMLDLRCDSKSIARWLHRGCTSVKCGSRRRPTGPFPCLINHTTDNILQTTFLYLLTVFRKDMVYPEEALQ